MKKRGRYVDLRRPRKIWLWIILLGIFVVSVALLFLNFDINLESWPVTGKAVFFQSQEGEANQTFATIDFSNEIGIIREDFYGVNTHSFLASGVRIDSDADGISDSYSNTSWHREKWLESGMKYIRDDMSLGSYYFYDSWNNLDFENWSNISIGFFSSDSQTGALGWKISAYGGASGFVQQSNDSHSGSYSLSAYCNQSSHVYIYRNVGLKIGNNYNFSVWAKPNGTMSIIIQRLDNYHDCSSTSFNGNGTEWKFISVSCNNAPYSGYRVVVDGINKDENILIDDASLTENSLPYISDYYFSGNLSSKTERLKWAKDNNIKILMIADYMPTWLADTSIEGCNKSKLTDCMPYDMEIWKNIVVDYTDRVTENGTYDNMDIEVWNEPYGGSLLSELPYDSPTKNAYYNLLYNATYNAIKSKYPNIAVGGPSGYHEAPNMLKGFLSNFSQQMDFVSVHPYLDKYESNTNGMYRKTKWLFDLCTIYNANCSRIINSEWNIGNVLIKNESQNYNRFGANMVLAYSDILNNWPSNVSMLLYQWSETKKYLPTTNYAEYPQRWSMVSEPALDNEYYPSYNITKNFATYHSAGSMIVKSNSSLVSIKVVASKKNDSQYITVINTGANASVSLNISNNISNGIKDLETGENYSIENGIAQIGNLEQYDIRYFINFNMSIEFPPEIPLNKSGNETDNNATQNETYNNYTQDYVNDNVVGGGGSSMVRKNANETAVSNISNLPIFSYENFSNKSSKVNQEIVEENKEVERESTVTDFGNKESQNQENEIAKKRNVFGTGQVIIEGLGESHPWVKFSLLSFTLATLAALILSEYLGRVIRNAAEAT